MIFTIIFAAQYFSFPIRFTSTSFATLLVLVVSSLKFIQFIILFSFTFLPFAPFLGFLSLNTVRFEHSPNQSCSSPLIYSEAQFLALEQQTYYLCRMLLYRNASVRFFMMELDAHLNSRLSHHLHTLVQ